MARKRIRRRRPYRRRKRYMRRKRAVGSRTVNLSPGRTIGFPNRAYITLPYATEKVISAANPYNQYVFNLMGGYDFDLTGGGHQPPGFDTCSLLYQRYRIYKVEMMIQIWNTSAVACRAGMYVTHDSADTFFDQSVYDLVDDKNTKTKLLLPSGTDGALATIRRTVDFQKEYFSKSNFWGDLQYGAAFTANPASSIYMTIGSGSIDGTTSATFTVTVQARLHMRLENLSIADKVAED